MDDSRGSDGGIAGDRGTIVIPAGICALVAGGAGVGLMEAGAAATAHGGAMLASNGARPVGSSNPHTPAPGVSAKTTDAYVGNAKGGGGNRADRAYVEKATGSLDGSRSLFVKNSDGKFVEIDWYKVKSNGDITLLDAKNAGKDSIYDVTRIDKWYVRTKVTPIVKTKR